MKRTLALAAMLVLGGLNFAHAAQADTGKSCCQPAAACCAPGASCCATKNADTKTSQAAPVQTATLAQSANAKVATQAANCCQAGAACCHPGAACCAH